MIIGHPGQKLKPHFCFDRAFLNGGRDTLDNSFPGESWCVLKSDPPGLHRLQFLAFDFRAQEKGGFDPGNPDLEAEAWRISQDHPRVLISPVLAMPGSLQVALSCFESSNWLTEAESPQPGARCPGILLGW